MAESNQEPWAEFLVDERELAQLILDLAEKNGVMSAGDQADLIERIFGKRP